MIKQFSGLPNPPNDPVPGGLFVVYGFFRFEVLFLRLDFGYLIIIS